MNLTELAGQIEGVYAMGAALTGLEVFFIGREKAKMLATAIADVQRHYPVNLNTPMFSLVKLGAAAAIVNVPILLTLAQRAAEKRAAQKRPATVAATLDEIIPGVDPANRPPMDFSGVAN